MENVVKGWLFAYGTLKVGFHWHHIIEDLVEEVHDAHIIGEMYSLGPFPCILLSCKGVVYGEAIKVSDLTEALKRCDHLEGYRPEDRENCHYLRRKVITFFQSGGWKPCYVYEYNIIRQRNHIPEQTPIELWEKGRAKWQK